MKQIKKAFFTLLMLLSIGVIAQNGMPKWAFPEANNSTNSSKLLDITSGSLSNLPHGPDVLWDYQGQVPERAYASFTDDNGDLLFFMVDETIFDKDGYVIANINSIQSPSGLSGTPKVSSDISIINVPGECDKYFIVFLNEEGRSLNQQRRQGYYYVKLDMTAPSITHANRLGALDFDHFPIYPTGAPFAGNGSGILKTVATPILQPTNSQTVSPNDFLPSSSATFTQPKNNERFMYLSGGNNVVRYRVTSQGFTADNYDLNSFFPTFLTQFGFFTTSAGNGSHSDADIRLMPNGNYRLAVPLVLNGGGTGWNSSDFPGWRGNGEVNILVLTINGQTGDFMNYVGIKSPDPSSNYVKGLEFSEDGRYLYFSMKYGNNLNYVDLHSSQVNKTLTPVNLNVSNAGDFRSGNIELGYDGKMYFARATGLGTLDDSNNPSSTWNANAAVFDLPERLPNSTVFRDKGYIIPSNLNNENYDHLNAFSNVSIGLSKGPYCAGETVTAYLISEGSIPNGYWSNQQGGQSTTFEVEQGTNTITFTGVNDFGCIESITTTFVAGPFSQLSLNANQNVICPNQGPTILSFDIQFFDPRNEIEAIIWTKDGDYHSDGNEELEVTEPGVYCVKIYDTNTGCFSTECVTITLGNCMNLDPTFNFVKTVGSTSYTVDVTANDPRTCMSEGWWITDITNGGNTIVSVDHFHSGQLSYTFQFGRTYEIKHGMWSACQSWTESRRTVVQYNRLKGGIMDEEGTLSDISVYPNPATNTLFVSEGTNFNNYVLYNMIGEKVAKGSESKISLEGLNKGMYFITFFDVNGSILDTKKIVKN